VVPPHAATIVYVQDETLIDSDGDGIPDSMDACPGTAPGAAVDASGCPLPRP
jgi:OOP family OmpA-OmpF porin